MTNKQLIDQYIENLCGYERKPRGRNGNLFYEGDVLYSYGYHFPLAWYQGGRTIAINTDKYSKSTSRHQSLLRQELDDYCVNEFIEDNTAGILSKMK